MTGAALGSWRGSIAGVAAALGLALLVSGCALMPSSDGDRRAENVAEQVAEQIGSHSANRPEITLLEMVAWWLPEGPISVGVGTAMVEPLAWSGESAGSQATIDIRVIVDVPAKSTTTIFGQGQNAGSATHCYRLEWEQCEPALRFEIPCPETPAPPRPTPAPRPGLNELGRERVAEILTSYETAADVEWALHDAYPQEYIRIETEAAGGELVVSVGIPAERECIPLVRGEGGEISSPGFRRISLEPGEMGCSTKLYTASPF